jgi:hypothetical protein
MVEVLQQMFPKANKIAQIGYLIHPLQQDVAPACLALCQRHTARPAQLDEAGSLHQAIA